MRNKAITTIFAVAVLLYGFSASGLAAEKGVTDNTIKVGIYGPITGSLALWYKLLYTYGASLVFDEVNKKGGVHGRKIEFIEEDSAFDVTQAVMATRRLIDKGVFAILGGVNSNGVHAARPIVARERIPFFSPGTGGYTFLLPFNDDPASGKWIFGGTLGTMRVQEHSVVEFAVEQTKAKRIGIIFHETSWGKSGYDGAKEKMDEYGLEFVAEETLSGDATDASVQILKLKEKKPDFVIATLLPRPTNIFVRQAHELGLKTTICGMFGSITDVRILKQVAGVSALRDFHYVMGVKDLVYGPGLAEWREKLEKAHPEEVGKKGFPNVFTFGCIGGTIAFVEGLERAGRNLTREGFRKALESLKDFDTGVLSSTVTFSSNDHVGIDRCIVVKYDGEKEEVVRR